MISVEERKKFLKHLAKRDVEKIYKQAKKRSDYLKKGLHIK